MKSRSKITVKGQNKKVHLVDIEILFIKEGDMIVAYCPALEVSSYGKDIKEAKAAFNEALEIFIEETEEKGSFERLLLRKGWKLAQLPSVNYEPPKMPLKDIKLVKNKTATVGTKSVAIPV
jgi:predicted RNase H-like HicB family nuclease